MAYNFVPLKTRIAEIGEWLAKEYGGIRTGRATPALLDHLQAEAYGAKMPLKQLGTMGVEDSRTLRFVLFDRTQIKAVETAISSANLGISAVADGVSLRIIFPELTAEKRQLLGKLAQEKAEEARVSLRKERERIWSDIQTQEKAGQLSEDDKFRLKDELQKIIDEANKKIDEMRLRKEQEIAS